MKVSIITVCKNAEATIEQAIQSIVSQTFPMLEYIVIDGASDDRTLEILHRYGDAIAHLVSEPDAGIYAAMNKGIHLATGDFLYFLNADDYLFDSTVIQDLVQFVVEHPDCDFVYGDHEARFPGGNASIHSPAPAEHMLEELVSLGECLIQPASFFKADLFERLGFFREDFRIASDYEWFSRLFQAPDVRIYYYPRTLVSYSHGGVSSQIRPLFEEVFAIQNQIPLYQAEPWADRRLQKLQRSFIDKYDALERVHRRNRHLEQELAAAKRHIAALEGAIAAMQSSKFWRLRSLWFRLKRAIGLTKESD